MGAWRSDIDYDDLVEIRHHDRYYGWRGRVKGMMLDGSALVRLDKADGPITEVSVDPDDLLLVERAGAHLPQD